ncbi:unnamed protein product, partial [Rotaria socialis]
MSSTAEHKKQHCSGGGEHGPPSEEQRQKCTLKKIGFPPNPGQKFR